MIRSLFKSSKFEMGGIFFQNHLEIFTLRNQCMESQKLLLRVFIFSESCIYSKSDLRMGKTVNTSPQSEETLNK